MNAVEEKEAYARTTAALMALDGEKVRLTYPNGARQTGVVSTKDYGHCVDVMLDNHGGQQYGLVTAIEVKRGTRYVAVAGS